MDQPVTVDNLPEEILIYVLTFLNFKQLLQLQSVSRRFRNVITASTALLYTIALGESGYYARRHSNSGTDEMLLALELLKKKWSSPQLELCENMTVPTRSIFKFPLMANGIIAYKPPRRIEPPEGTDARNVVQFIAPTSQQLRENDSGGSILETWHADIPSSVMSIFAADLSQDLLITRSSALTEGSLITLNILSLRSNIGHPQCSIPNHTLNIIAPASWISDNPHYTRGQILGDTLSVTFGDMNRAVHGLYSWTTGRYRCVLDFSVPDEIFESVPSGLALLADDTILVGQSREFDNIPTLCVYALRSRASNTDDPERSSHEPFLVAQYELPAIKTHPVRFTISPFDTSKSVHIGHFAVDPAAAIVHIDLSMGNRAAFEPPTRRDQFFTPAAQFVRHAERARTAGNEWEPEMVPWKVWGPSQTRWVNPRAIEELDEDDEEMLAVAKTLPAGPDQPWGDLTRLAGNREGARMVFPGYIVDFAPMELARASHHVQHSPVPISGSELADSASQKIISEPTIIVAKEYTEPIFSYLPYREITLDPQLECDDIMLVGETIITLSNDYTEIQALRLT